MLRQSRRFGTTIGAVALAVNAGRARTGADGLPDLKNAGNVLRPYTAFKLSLRLPPLVDAAQAVQQPLRQLKGSGSPCCSKLRRMYSPSGTSRRIVRPSWRQCTVIGWLRRCRLGMAGIQTRRGDCYILTVAPRSHVIR